jgi:lauroyl/myristoyl acyltransferase
MCGSTALSLLLLLLLLLLLPEKFRNSASPRCGRLILILYHVARTGVVGSSRRCSLAHGTPV